MIVELHWAVKESLLRYIADAPRSRIALEGVTAESDFFRFPLAEAEGRLGEGSGALRFTGSVGLFGHFGMPIQQIVDPWIEWTDGDRALLSVRRWPGREERLPGWDLRPLVSRGDELRAGLVRLLPSGAEMFGGQYATGTEFAPLIVAGYTSQEPTSKEPS